MLYPLYIHMDKHSAYGASFPDLPGLFAAADELNDLPAMAQEAIAAMFEGEAHIPDATSIEQWTNAEEYKEWSSMRFMMPIPPQAVISLSKKRRSNSIISLALKSRSFILERKHRKHI